MLADPRRRRSRPVALPPRRGVRHDASLLRPGSRGGRLRERPHATTIASPAPTAATVTCSPGGPSPRPSWPSCSGARRGQRRPSRLDEHRRPRPRRDRLLRHRRRQHRSRHRAPRSRCEAPASIAVAYFGDGATNQAYFFECLNFAKVLNLPVVFVCENNGYGEYTPTEAVTAGPILARAAAMGLPTTEVDGMDVWAVRDTALDVTERVRGGGGPEFVEARTYRFVGHSRSDPGKYRPPGELERWRERDPLRRRRATASRPSTGWEPTTSGPSPTASTGSSTGRAGRARSAVPRLSRRTRSSRQAAPRDTPRRPCDD